MLGHDEHNHFFGGLLLVTIGAAWTAVNLGLVSDDIVKYWPLLIVVVGLWKLLHQPVLHD
jgi:hypothetical protein